MDRCHGAMFVARYQFGTAAPGQKIRVILDPVDQFEHAFGGVCHQHTFFDTRHRC